MLLPAFGGNHEGDFAARRFAQQAPGELGQGAEPVFFVDLGHFPGHGCLAGPEEAGELFKELRGATRRFEEDQGPRRLARALQERSAFRPAASRRETEEREGVRRQAGNGEGRGHRRRTRHGPNRQIFGPCRTNHAVARIRDQGGAGITDQRQIFARAQPVEEEFNLTRFVVVVAGDEAGGEAEPGAEPPGHAGVLAGNPGNVAQDGKGPRRQVVEVSDGGRNDKERAPGPLSGSGVHSANRNPLAGLPRQRERRKLSVLPDNGSSMDDRTAWTGRRVLVTGAAGFIGSRLAARLSSAGARVTGFDRVRHDFRTTNIRFRQGDLGDPGAHGDAVAGAEVIFHLAAAGGHRRSMDEPRVDFEDNVMGTVALLGAVAERAPRARVVFASTRQLYGPAERLPAGEDQRIAPPDVHSVHKETAEHLVRRSAEARGTRFSILRLTNTYGPGQATTGPSAGLTGRFLGDALAGREITILGDPGLLRDFNHVDDVVDAFLPAGSPEAPAGIWNLGSPPIRLGEFADAIFRALGEEPRVRAAPLPPGFEAIAIGDFHSDWSAIRRDLGWAPRRPLASGLAETVRAMRAATE